MSSSMPPKYKDFICPVCESTDYEQITKSNSILGPGSRTWIDYCICKGCSIIFKDAKNLSKANTKINDGEETLDK